MANHIEKIEHEAFVNRVLGHGCLATDPIGMEFLIESIDPAIRNQVAAVRLEMVANVYRSISEGAAKAAKIFAGGR